MLLANTKAAKIDLMDMRGRYPKSDEHKAKLSAAAKRQWADWKARGVTSFNSGIKMGPEARANMSRARRGNQNALRHGYSRYAAYNVYWKMIGRCYNEKSPSYPRYGGRGITVCDRWLGEDGFPNFLADMGERPDNPPEWTRRYPYWTLDRIDNDGPYAPDNCRWVTNKEQSANKRPRTYLGKKCDTACTCGRHKKRSGGEAK